MKTAQAFERHGKYISPNFVKLLQTLGYGRIFVKAEGTRLWDAEGREYLDMISGCGSANLGYNHPDIIAAAEESLRSNVPSFLQVAPIVEAGLLAEELAKHLDPQLSMAAFGNSGAEAVEGALKLAFAATRRTGVAYCKGSYHGLTLGTLSVMGNERHRGSFPAIPDCEMITFGDLAAAERVLGKKTCAALLIEPIQIEGGVRLAPDSYFRGLRALCDRTRTALIFDEVQTGMGRTGSLFAYQSMGVVPDILCYSKAFSGGLVPIGGYSTSPEWQRRAYGKDDIMHASTFSGNSLAAAVARKNLELIDDALLAHVTAMGQHVDARFAALAAKHPAVAEARGRGLIWAIQFAPPTSGLRKLLTLGIQNVISRSLFAHWVSVQLLERGFVTETLSHDETTLRFEPALTIERADIDRFVDALDDVLQQNQSFSHFARTAATRLFEQKLGRQGSSL